MPVLVYHIKEKLKDYMSPGPADRVCPCDICEDTLVPASKSCMDCLAHLCDACCAKHQELTGGRHNVVDLNNVTYCIFHRGHAITLYCEQCDACCCIQCAMKPHAGHFMSPVAEKRVLQYREMNSERARASKQSEKQESATKRKIDPMCPGPANLIKFHTFEARNLDKNPWIKGLVFNEARQQILLSIAGGPNPGIHGYQYPGGNKPKPNHLYKGKSKGLCMDSHRERILTVGNSKYILAFDRNMKQVDEMTFPQFVELRSISYYSAKDLYLVTDVALNMVFAVDPTQKTIVKSFGETNDLIFECPLHVYSLEDTEGLIAVSCLESHHIKLFNFDGRQVRQYGRQGTDEGELNQPLGITGDINGKIVVCDYLNGRATSFWTEEGEEKARVTTLTDPWEGHHLAMAIGSSPSGLMAFGVKNVSGGCKVIIYRQEH